MCFHGMSSILVYFARPGISCFLVSPTPLYFVLLGIWYLVVSDILCFRIPYFLHLVLPGISRILVSHTSYVRSL